jgi:hypothetical protein
MEVIVALTRLEVEPERKKVNLFQSKYHKTIFLSPLGSIAG